jgi:cysteine synthase A
MGQFENPANAAAHRKTTGPEIWEDTEGKVDIFVATVGTGGTLTGTGEYLKEKNPNIKVVAVEPKDVSALLGHEPGLHQIQGIGDGFVPEVLDTALIDEVVEVSDADAIYTTRKMAEVYGLLCGTSSGANVWAAIQMANKYGREKRVATILADRIERYFSTNLL